MGLALADLYNGAGYPLATWNYAIITAGEKKATKELTENDVHFGRNWTPALTVPATVSDQVDKPLDIYGPRCIDIKKRGGTVAELMWEDWQKDPEKVNVSGFLSFFNEFNNRPPKSVKFEREGSMFGNADFKGATKYNQDQHRGQISIVEGKGVASGYTFMNFGVRWSKTALEWTRKHKGIVHMHLEGLGDVQNIVTRGGDPYTYNVSQRELRYVYRYWDRFKDMTYFYNGYDGDFNAIQVNCPW